MLIFYYKTESYINQIFQIRLMETVTIPKAEYERLKKLEKVDWELVESFKRSLEDVKEGRIRRVK